MQLFAKLFKKHVVTPPFDVLGNTSGLVNDPANAVVPLWIHQRAMVKKCMDIEKLHVIDATAEQDANKFTITVKPTNCDRYKTTLSQSFTTLRTHVGIMNDPPGSGKTFAALALMAMDQTPTINIVIVPPNLHHQWVEAAERYFKPNTFKIMKVVEYADTMNMWRTNKVFQDVRLIITSTLFADPVASALESLAADLKMPTVIERVFIDEVDTATSLMHNIPACKRIWLMSASFDPVTHTHVGPIDVSGLPKDALLNMICRCDDSLIKKSQQLEEPTAKMITVPDGDLSLFLNGAVTNEMDITFLNALNFKRVKARNSHYVTPDDAYTMMDYAVLLKDALEKELEGLQEVDPDLIDAQLEQRMHDLESRIKVFKDNILHYKKEEGSKTKVDVIKELCLQMKETPQTKWIFFSDDDALFDVITPILDGHDMKYATMNAGTVEKAEQAIKKYKEDPNVRALFINSMRDGCGLNLENTTHILFLHKTNQYMSEQVVGRAQRPGRTCQLEVICLYHENEARDLA